MSPDQRFAVGKRSYRLDQLPLSICSSAIGRYSSVLRATCSEMPFGARSVASLMRDIYAG